MDYYIELKFIMKMGTLSKVLLFLTHCLIIPGTFHAADTIQTANSITDDGHTLVSPGTLFELGFFSPGNSTNRYVGIWYKNVEVRTVVWVANREAPIPNKSGVLELSESGILVLLNATNGTMLWSSIATRPATTNPVAKLLDSGNLVVTDGVDNLWESFHHPTDTHMLGMKVGRNSVTGLKSYLTSWKSDEDPAPGDFKCYIDPMGYPQVYIDKKGTLTTRAGPWNGVRFRWSQYQFRDPAIRTTMIVNEEEISFTIEGIDNSVISRFMLGRDGVFRRQTWDGEAKEWRNYIALPADDCDQYGLCGASGFCTIGGSPLCTCLDKFVPKNPERWARADWTGGCIRRTNLSCKTDGFVRYSRMKLPEARNTVHKERLSLDGCRAECLQNCTCMAYSQLDLGTRSGCLFWKEAELIDIRDQGDEGQDIYIRMAASELDSGGKKSTILIGSMVLSAAGMVLLLVFMFLYVRKKKNNYARKKKNNKKKSKATKGRHHGENQENLELPIFRYSVVLKATDNFSLKNKLGEGGFGPVFKGILGNGQEIAVKCPSKTSTQGIDEFETEAIFIAKLQHRNLVRLLGCCTQGDQNMLIYEYMSNGSLDDVLFDQRRCMLLDWPKRFNIIHGIARGLLYLHEDSRLRIIHRDLKASNILLDSNFDPKISDFGIARSFGNNHTPTKTCRIVGTYGYMSPEYAVDGEYSIKSDVFSFGVLLLEIVSGKKNRGFSHPDHHLNLLGHAWMLYKEERSIELVDTSLGSGFSIAEVLRLIHVGLLCVQRRLEDRPTMSAVVLMMGSESALPPISQPGFFTERDRINDHGGPRSKNSINGVTITVLEGR